MLATLKHYWPVHLAVVLGACVTTAVLSGALTVGDSVRESLRRIALERLGRIESALVAPRFFGVELAGALEATAPLIVVHGSAGRDQGERASGVGIHGVDARFFEVFGAERPRGLSPDPGLVFPPVVINEALARELGAAVGEALVLRFARASDVPLDTLMGDADTDAVLGALRVTLSEIVPDRGLGSFGLAPTQHVPFVAYVDLERLGRALGARGRVNAMVSSRRPAELSEPLGRALRLEDYGITLDAAEAYVEVASREFVLAPRTVEAVHEAAGSTGGRAQNVQAYLANRLARGDRSVPYAMVAAVDPLAGARWAELRLVDGAAAPALSTDGILLNTWAARELDAAPGDEIELTYFVVGAREQLRVESMRLVLEGVVAMEGLGADRGLVPDYPGIREAEDMAAWDPPFPVDLSAIRPADEQYWDEHGATPKAFVSEETGAEAWATHHGTVTSVRVAPPAEAELGARLLERLEPAEFGLGFEPVRDRALAAARGATEFGQLFLAFSAFLIGSAALLVGLLFRLGVERRAPEIGLLLATGHRVRTVRARLLAEGAVLSVVGCALGIAAGVGYAAAMMAGLRTLWRPAVGSSQLGLAWSPSALATGFAIGVLVVLGSIALAVRKLVRVAPSRLLAGTGVEHAEGETSPRTRALAWAAASGAAGLAFYAIASGNAASPALAFGSGSLVLIAGLAAFSVWCRRSRRRTLGRGMRGRVAMAARNSTWIPGRSILSVSLVASASFVLAVVALSRSAAEEAVATRTSGAGGFRLLAASDVPLYHDLATGEGREELGFPDESRDAFAGVEVHAFRVKPGDDASCLNLYRPDEPRVLGVNERFVARGGFTFAQHVELPPGVTDPWRLLDLPLEPGVVPAIADVNSATWILHLGLGEELTLEGQAGEPVRLRLVALLSRSLFQSELLISEARMREHFPSIAGDGYFLFDVPAERAGALSLLLESTLDPFGFDVTPTGERLAGYRVVENTYMATFQLLGGLGLLLGTIGLAVVLVRNVIERRGELATLRAFGFRRGTLAGLVLAENAFLLAVGVGLGVSAALVAAAPRVLEAPPSVLSLVLTLGLVLLTGMAAAGAAVAGALRTPLLATLKAER